MAGWNGASCAGKGNMRRNPSPLHGGGWNGASCAGKGEHMEKPLTLCVHGCFDGWQYLRIPACCYYGNPSPLQTGEEVLCSFPNRSVIWAESQRIVETSLLLALTIPSHNLSRLQMICIAPVLSCHVAQVKAIGAFILVVFWSRAEAYIYATEELTLPLSSMDSDLEAFSHNPTDGSFSPMAFQPSEKTNYLNQRFLSY